MELTATDIHNIYKNCVAIVIVRNNFGQIISQGSGVILKKEKILLTNFHVIRDFYIDRNKIEIIHNCKTIEHTGVLGKSYSSDIAIIKLKNTNGIKKIKYANIKNLKTGEKIYSIGNPLNYANTIDEGIIGNLNTRPDFFQTMYKNETKKLIQISVNLSFGSSGGAVVNSKGELIGVSTFTDSRGNNINFAIPIEEYIKLYYKNKNKNAQQVTAFSKYFISTIKNQYENSLEQLNEIIGDNIDKCYFYFAFIEKAKILIKLNRNTEAINYINRLLRKKEYFKKRLYINSFILKGQLYCSCNKFDKAINILQDGLEVIKKMTTNNKIQYEKEYMLDNESDIRGLLGFIYLFRNDNKNALKELNHSIALNPKNFISYSYRGLFYSKNKEYEKSATDFSKSLEIDHTFFLSFAAIGDACYDEKNYEEALSWYTRSIEKLKAFPKQALDVFIEFWPYIGQSKTLIKLKRFDEAISALEPIRDNKKIEYVVRETIGAALFWKGEIEKSLKELNISIKLISYYSPSYFWRSVVYSKQNKLKKAFQDINRAIEIDPEEIDYYEQRCLLYRKYNDYNNALNDCERILKLNKDSHGGLLLRASVYIELSNYEKALYDYETLLEKFPNNIDILKKCGSFYILASNFKKAKQIFIKLTKINPKSDFYFSALGLIYYKLGNIPNAVSNLNKAIQLNPHNFSDFYYRGLVSKDLKLFNQAISDLEKSVILNLNMESEITQIIEEIKKEALISQYKNLT